MGVYLITEYASRGDVFGELDRRGGTMSEGEAVRQVRPGASGGRLGSWVIKQLPLSRRV